MDDLRAATESHVIASCGCCLRADVRAQAVRWLNEHGWDVVPFTDHTLRCALEERYPGGWAQFQRDLA